MADTADMPMPQPTEEHQKLEGHCGVWNVDCTFYMDPTQPPMKVQAKETVDMFGGFWTVSLFEADMFGMPFQGRATLGFDPSSGEYVSTWFDTMSPQLFNFRGKFEGDTLSMRGEGWDCMVQGPATYRTTEQHHADGTRTFEMFMTPQGGEEMKLFTHVYSRAS